jgi:hypothetical protein
VTRDSGKLADMAKREIPMREKTHNNWVVYQIKGKRPAKFIGIVYNAPDKRPAQQAEVPRLTQMIWDLRRVRAGDDQGEDPDRPRSGQGPGREARATPR